MDDVCRLIVKAKKQRMLDIRARICYCNSGVIVSNFEMAKLLHRVELCGAFRVY